MIFTSYTYLVFLGIIFFVHWSLRANVRKFFLILASYFFYASWKWEFCFLLLALSIFNWVYGRWVLTKSKRLSFLFFGILINLTPLVYFKYFGFLVVNLSWLAHFFGLRWDPILGQIFLPLGISFFTFQGVAYLVDIASGEEPFIALSDFFLFKAFWPQLVAGPILRLNQMREQIMKAQPLDYDDFSVGCRRILFGLFKKAVLADNLAPVVDMVFSSAASPNAVDCLTGILGFGLQIYFDFSGYSDIAIGSARLFGFKFPENFNWPYLAFSPQEFWNRWHMTLSKWIRDYLFLPMSFAARRMPQLVLLSTVAAMGVCGLWHGAAWTFVIWGLWHGLLLLLNQTLLRRFFSPLEKDAGFSKRLNFFGAWVVTFSLTQYAWLFFRARSFAQVLGMTRSLIFLDGGIRPSILRESQILFVMVVLLSVFFLQTAKIFIESLSLKMSGPQFYFKAGKWLVYTALIMAVIVFNQEVKTFVYFQF